MKDEVDAASRWWTTQLGKTVSDEQILETFRRCLAEVMTERYTGHWYEDDRLRGSGYRSISFDNRLDPVLVTAAKRAGIDSKLLIGKEKAVIEPTDVDKVMSKLLDHSRGKIMFINPGEVKLANAALLSAPARCIWDRTNGANKSGVDWDEEVMPAYKTQFDGDTSFESPLASPPSTPHMNPLPAPPNAQQSRDNGFYPHRPFAAPLERLEDPRGSTSSAEPSPNGASALPPRLNYAPPPHTPSHVNGPNPHTVSAHNHHTSHPHHTAHANLGGGR